MIALIYFIRMRKPNDTDQHKSLIYKQALLSLCISQHQFWNIVFLLQTSKIFCFPKHDIIIVTVTFKFTSCRQLPLILGWKAQHNGRGSPQDKTASRRLGVWKYGTYSNAKRLEAILAHVLDYHSYETISDLTFISLMGSKRWASSYLLCLNNSNRIHIL